MNVHVIFACDRWKSKDSMRLIMVSDVENLEKNLAAIQSAWEYTDEDMKTYIHVEEVELNEFDG